MTNLNIFDLFLNVLLKVWNTSDENEIGRFFQVALLKNAEVPKPNGRWAHFSDLRPQSSAVGVSYPNNCGT